MEAGCAELSRGRSNLQSDILSSFTPLQTQTGQRSESSQDRKALNNFAERGDGGNRKWACGGVSGLAQPMGDRM